MYVKQLLVIKYYQSKISGTPNILDIEHSRLLEPVYSLNQDYVKKCYESFEKSKFGSKLYYMTMLTVHLANSCLLYSTGFPKLGLLNIFCFQAFTFWVYSTANKYETLVHPSDLVYRMYISKNYKDLLILTIPKTIFSKPAYHMKTADVKISRPSAEELETSNPHLYISDGKYRGRIEFDKNIEFESLTEEFEMLTIEDDEVRAKWLKQRVEGL